MAPTIDDYKLALKKLADPECHTCHVPLPYDELVYYPHSDGWPVKWLEKQWLYVVCPGCGYEWAIWKLFRDGIAKGNYQRFMMWVNTTHQQQPQWLILPTKTNGFLDMEQKREIHHRLEWDDMMGMAVFDFEEYLVYDTIINESGDINQEILSGEPDKWKQALVTDRGTGKVSMGSNGNTMFTWHGVFEPDNRPCNCGVPYLIQGIVWWCPDCKNNFIVEDT